MQVVAKSFASRILAERPLTLFLVQGTVLGAKAWYFIEVMKQKIPVFQEALKREPLDLKPYGEILYKGWGAEPPADIVAKLKEEYK